MYREQHTSAPTSKYTHSRAGAFVAVRTRVIAGNYRNKKFAAASLAATHTHMT